MTCISKTAPCLGAHAPSLPDVESHTTSDDDYVFDGDWHNLSKLLNAARAPSVRIKKVRVLVRDGAAPSHH